MVFSRVRWSPLGLDGRVRPLTQRPIGIVAGGGELQHDMREVPHQRRHEAPVSVDERRCLIDDVTPRRNAKSPFTLGAWQDSRFRASRSRS